jgi:hypothetical protein
MVGFILLIETQWEANKQAFLRSWQSLN